MDDTTSIPGPSLHWRRRPDGSLELLAHRKVVAELPPNARSHAKAIAVLDYLVPTLTDKQRDLFGEVTDMAATGLDPHALISVIHMIRAGHPVDRVAKYVGASVPPWDQGAEAP